ncbi:MAG: glycosyltransferase [Patescibacteria group bacterium]|jgi:glycosyltransferase involved in cell wall biosynthesis
MKIAIVFDDLTQFGGAERLLLAVLDIWPDAPLYTSVASKEWVELLEKRGTTLKTSFMQKLPFKKRLNRLYGALGLHILAMESFDLSGYEVVFSISSRYAHGVVTKPGTKHICYMNSPGRMFWEPNSYFENEGFFTRFKGLSLSHQRLWDYSASHRVDRFIANSLTPRARIKKYYGLDSHVIYPFYEFPKTVIERGSSPYFLVISRLQSWKKIDIAIKACGELHLPLKIIGDGPQRKALQKLAKKYENIEVLGYVTEEEKYDAIAGSKALIQTQLEDFGIVPLEVMACGKLVIAFGAGGALETVVPGETGEFFGSQTVESLMQTLKTFDPQRYSTDNCRKRAEAFTKERFQKEVKSFVDTVYLEKL